jgi:putative drug exporter of the RND superfamily
VAAHRVGGRRAKWVVLALWIVLVLVFAPLGLKLPQVTNDEIVLPSASETARADRLLATRFPGGDLQYALLVYRRAGGLTGADRARIVADAGRARTAPLVVQTLPPFGPHAAPGLVSRNGAVAMSVVALGSKKVFRVQPTIDDLRKLRSGADGLEVHVTGQPALLSDFNGAVKEADVKLLLATGLLVLLLLVAVYRSPVLALVPLVVVGIAYSVASGVLYLLAKAGLAVDSTSTSLLLVLMFGAGTDYCLLLIGRYRANLRGGLEIEPAVFSALARAAPPMVASGVTVIAALLAMLTGTLGLNRTLGPVNAIGIAIVLLAGLTLLPALLALLGDRAFWPTHPRARESSRAAGLWLALGTRVRAHPAPWLAAIVLLLGAGAGGIATYHLHADWFRQFRQQTDGTRGYAALRSGFPPGVLAPTEVLVDRSDGALRPADIALVRRRLGSASGVAAVSGVQRRSTDGRAAQLSLTLAADPFGADAIRQVTELRHGVSSVAPGVRVLLAEGTARQVDFKAAATRDTHVIGPIVLAVVLLTLIVLLRALVAPLFLLATVVLTYVATLGLSLLAFRYLFGQHLVDPELLLIVFIFLVALGSDYNIFLMSRAREEAQEHGTHEGMLRAVVETGPVITSAGLVLAGTFSVLTVLPIWELLEIGFAAALGVLIDTFVVRSILVPALVWLVGDRSWWPSTAQSGARAPITGSFPILSGAERSK